MKRKIRRLIAAICALVFVGFLAGPVVHAAEEVTITGTVTPEGLIVVGEGEEYVIEHDDIYDDLMEVVGKKVEATGTVEDKEGKKVIDVEEFELVQ